MIMRRANSAVAMIKRVIRKGSPSPRRSHYERRLKLWCSVMDQTHYESMVHGSGIRFIGKVNGKKVSSGPYLLEAVSNGLSFRWRLTGRVPVSFFPKWLIEAGTLVTAVTEGSLGAATMLVLGVRGALVELASCFRVPCECFW